MKPCPTANMRSFASWEPGKTVSDIAQELSLSVKTVSVSYRTLSSLEKMGMTKTSELMLYSIDRRLVPSGSHA